MFELLRASQEELKEKIDFGLKNYYELPAVKDYLAITTHAHKAVTEVKELRDLYSGVDWSLSMQKKR